MAVKICTVVFTVKTLYRMVYRYQHFNGIPALDRHKVYKKKEDKECSRKRRRRKSSSFLLCCPCSPDSSPPFLHLIHLSPFSSIIFFQFMFVFLLISLLPVTSSMILQNESTHLPNYLVS
jgi:hypothetical protein